MNALELFLVAPSAENFEKIKGNAWMLTRVFQKNEELAKKYFKFEEWLKITKFSNQLTSDEDTSLKKSLKTSVSSFAEAIKYYYTLGYEDRTAWQREFIDHAKTVKDCQYLLYTLNNGHRKEIVEKMQKVAKTDEEKKIAYSYAIGMFIITF